MENILSKIADIAEPFMGLKEEYKNQASWLQKLWDATWYPEGMKNREPYCMAGCSYCIQQAAKADKRISLKNPPRMASVKEFIAWALLAENGCVTYRFTGPNGAYQPTRGDIVTFTWSHIGIVSGSATFNKSLGSYVIPTYEFNTSSGMAGSQRDGEGNYKRERLRSDCNLFVRLPCKATKA